MELTILGASGSYAAPAGGACSGYLVRAGEANLWMDCGNGSFANLQRHLPVEDLTAVIITHQHPDHCVDLYSLHVLLKYGGLERSAPMPVYCPEGVERHLGVLVDGDWGGAFDWRAAGDGDGGTVVPGCDLRFSRTSHPVPTLAVEVAADGKRLAYTSDTGPEWSVEAFGAGADLVLSEATLQGDVSLPGVHLSARQAGEAARAAGARRLVLTHLWPRVDPQVSVVEGSEAFGAPVTLAAPHARVRI